MKTVTAYTTSHAYEIPADCVADIARTGPNDAAVESWVPRIDWTEWDADQVRDELRDAGAWSEEQLADDLANRGRILWILAWNVRDDEEHGEDA